MRSPSSSSGSGGSSGSSDSDAADPHQAAIERRRARSPAEAGRSGGDARGADTELVVHYVAEPHLGAELAGGAAAGEAERSRQGVLRRPRGRFSQPVSNSAVPRCSAARRRSVARRRCARGHAG